MLYLLPKMFVLLLKMRVLEFVTWELPSTMPLKW
jgi:hypothetical protein